MTVTAASACLDICFGDVLLRASSELDLGEGISSIFSMT